MQSFRDLLVWQKAMDMCQAVYAVTNAFPREEIYGLSAQMRRSAVSVASNIAEGRGRLTEGEFRQFLGTAQGSNYELQTQILLAGRLDFGGFEQRRTAEDLSDEVGRMLSSLLSSLKRLPPERDGERAGRG